MRWRRRLSFLQGRGRIGGQGPGTRGRRPTFAGGSAPRPPGAGPAPCPRSLAPRPRSPAPGPRPPSGRAGGREAGSAYLIALLALVVLTIIGLALAAVTQTEDQIAANERTLQRTFYAADSGLAAATVRLLTQRDTSPLRFTLPEPGTLEQLDSRQTVTTAPVVPLLDAWCNLCAVNSAGNYGASDYRKVTYAITATAEREAGPDGELLAQKTLATMVDVEPQPAAVSDYRPLTDPEELSRVRY